jgi:hypothetical protein
MAYFLPREMKGEYDALRATNWRKLRVASSAAGLVMFVLATAAEGLGFGAMIGISTFLAGLWLSFYLSGLLAAETLRKRLNR